MEGKKRGEAGTGRRGEAGRGRRKGRRGRSEKKVVGKEGAKVAKGTGEWMKVGNRRGGKEK